MAGTFEAGSIIARLRAEDSEFVKDLKSAIGKAKEAGTKIGKSLGSASFGKKAIATFKKDIDSAASKLNTKLRRELNFSNLFKLGSLNQKIKSFFASTQGSFRSFGKSASAALVVPFNKFREGFSRTLSISRRFARGVSRAFSPLTNAFRFMRRQIFSLRGLLIGLGTGFGVLSLIQRAKDIDSVSLAFDGLSKSVGAVSSSFLQELRKATRGAVSDLELMRTTNNANLLGVVKSQEEFAKLANLARRLGRALGRDPVDALHDLSVGLGRQSRLILDNLGIVVRVDDANKKYAASIGKTAKQLTLAERNQAFYNAAMDSAEKKVERLGEDFLTISDRIGRFQSSISNTANTIARNFVRGGAFDAISDFLESNKLAIGAFSSFVADTIGIMVERVQALLRSLINDSVTGTITKLLIGAVEITVKSITAIVVEGAKALFGDLGSTILQLLGNLFGRVLTLVVQESSNIYATFERDLQAFLLKTVKDVPIVNLFFDVATEQAFTKRIDELNKKLKEKLGKSAAIVEENRKEADASLDKIGKKADSVITELAANAITRLANVWQEIAKGPGIVAKQMRDIASEFKRVSAIFRLSSIDVFQDFQQLSLQDEIQDLGTQFERLVNFRRKIIKNLPEQIGEQGVERTGEELLKLKKLLEDLNKAFLDFKEGPKEAKKELAEAFVAALRRAEEGMRNTTKSLLDLGNETVKTALKGGKLTGSIVSVGNAIIRLAKLSTTELGLKNIALAFIRALKPITTAQEDFDELIKKFKEREKTLQIEVATLGLGDAAKEVKLLELAIKDFQDSFDPDQKKEVDKLRESLARLGGEKDAANKLKDLAERLNRMSDEAEDARIHLMGLQQGELAATFASIDEEVKKFKEDVQKTNVELREKLRLITLFEKAAKDLKESLKKEKIEEVLGEDLDRVIVTRVGGALSNAFRKGESISKQWAELTAGFFEDALNDALKNLSNVVKGYLAKAFSSEAGAAGAAGIATGLLGIAGLIFNQLQSKKTSTVEDFSEAINSSEAVRGVVAGPTNVAISKIGNSLKEALRTTEVLLERIAIGVEGGAFGSGAGFGPSGGGLAGNAILPLTTSTQRNI